MSSTPTFDDRIAHAYRTREWLPIDASVNEWPVDEVYDVQDRVMARVFTEWGDHLAGYKISVTAAEDQALIDTDEPTYGQFAAGRILASGSTLPLAAQNAMLLEPELVIRPLVDLTSSMGPAELAESVEVTGGLELPTSRFRDWVAGPDGSPLTVSSLVLDNAVAGYVALGDGWTRLDTATFADISAEIRLDGEPIVSGHSTRVMGSPLTSLAWLIARLGARGQTLTAGTVVSSGTFAPPQLARPGTYTVTFDQGVAGPAVELS